MSIPIGTGITGPTSTPQLTGTYDLLPDVAKDVTFYDLQSSIIMTLLMTLGRAERTVQPTFNWKEDQLDYPSYTCTTSIPATGAGTPFSMTVGYGRVVPGDTVVEPFTSQVFEWQTISSQNATQTIGTVLKVPSTVATTAVAANAQLINMGTHMVEGGPFPKGIGQTPLNLSNITDITAGAVEITWTMLNSGTYWGPQFEYDKQAKITQSRGDMERKLIWGKRVKETRTQTVGGNSVTNEMRGSQGALDRIQSHRTTYSSFDEDTLNTFIRSGIWGSRNSGSRQKIAACGPTMMGYLDDLANTKVRFLDKAQTDYGINVQAYLGYGGRKLYIVEEKEFFDNPAYAGAMLVLDPGYMKLRYIGQSLMQVVDATQPGLTQYKIAWYTEHGLEMRAEQFAGILNTQ